MGQRIGTDVWPSKSPGGCAQNLSIYQEGAVSSSTRRCPLSEPETATSGMQGVRRKFIKCNIPGKIAKARMSSWRPAKRKQYDSHIPKRKSTFQKFYNKPFISRNSFAGAVLKFFFFVVDWNSCAPTFVAVKSHVNRK